MNDQEKEIRWVADNTIFTHFTFDIFDFEKILKVVLDKLENQYDEKLVRDITKEVYNELVKEREDHQ